MLRNLFLTLSALCLSCVPALAAERFDETPRTVVMTAYSPEWNALVPAIQSPVEYKLNGMTFLAGTLEGKPVVLMMSGVSIVNAAMNTQLVLDRFNVKRIVFSGVAGGVDPSLNIGDVLIADQWGQYMEVSFARWTKDGWMPPEPVDPAAPKNWEFMFPRGVYIGNADEAPSRRHFFPVDPVLLDAARKVAPMLILERCVPPPQAGAQVGPETGKGPIGLCLPQAPKVVVGGCPSSEHLAQFAA
jgi:adenosylhomocysteine nucleosidase